MFHSMLLAAAGTGFTFLMTALGAATIFLLSKKNACSSQNVILGFAGGVMTAATVWSLLLPALAQEGTLPAWVPAAVGMLLGAGFLMGMDALIPHLQTQSIPGDSLLLIAAITLHNIPEGMAVGLAFALADGSDSLVGATALALGIGVQNFPEGAAVSLPLVKQGLGKGKSFLVGVCSGIVEPLFGILAVVAATFCKPLMPWVLGFAAGAMLWVTVEELVPQAQGRNGTLGFFIGFLLMMILDVALG